MARRKSGQGTVPITVIVPMFNEAGNVTALLERIDHSFTKAGISYKLLIVDDHSSDDTWKILKKLQSNYPMTLLLKDGEKGKAASLKQAFEYVDTPYTAFLDADLQYPPEALPEMLSKIENDEADVIVARRQFLKAGLLRKIVSATFRIGFGHMLWGLKCDVQSGQKVFRSEILRRMDVTAKPWTFDLEFLVVCRSAGYRIGEHDVVFAPRVYGRSNVHIVKTSLQVGLETIRLRFNPPHLIPFAPDKQGAISGFHYKGKPFEPRNKLVGFETALQRFSIRQISFMLLLGITMAIGFITWFHTALAVLVGSLTILYFSDLLLNVLMVVRSYFFFEEETVANDDTRGRRSWPKYTVFCPLYKEAEILPQFVKAMEAIDYPKRKLEIMLLLEANDQATIDAARAMELPSTFKITVVPHAMPKTKPKACNYGLNLATGEYAVIYDAEDIPDPLQLKKAVIAFERAPGKIGCIQAKLNYYNWDQNLLTRLFTLEYTLWFNLVLPGLQSINAPIPLGGTSNHFRINDLRGVGGWDPFNVTEDADLGIRLAKQGFSTLILDSTTLEEANSQFWNWIRQRSRWIKGYIQTYFVHTRKMSSRQSRRDFFIFQLLIGGKVLSALINPVFWLVTVLYFAVRGQVGNYIHSLYGPAIFYVALATLLIGNFLYLYIYMMAAAKNEHNELILTTFAVPFYWLMISIATVKAIYEFIVKPFHWQKTKHGLHLQHMQSAQQSKAAQQT